MSDESHNTAVIFTIGYRQFYDAGSDEEEALAEATKAVEETDLERQTALYQSQHEERAEEEPRASTSAASAEPIPLQPESDDDEASTILNPSLMFSDRSDILAVYRQARANDDDGAIAGPSYHHHRQQEDDIVQPENQLGVYPMDAQQEEEEVEEEEERLNEERLEARRFALWFQELMECDSDIQTGGGRTRNTQGNEAFGDVQPPGGRIIITHDTARYFKRFQLRGREETLRICQPHAGANVTACLEGAFRDLLTHLMSHCEGGDYAGISFSASCLAHGPVWLSFRPVCAYTFVDIWQLITNIAQSAASLDIKRLGRVSGQVH
ncbi:uncharacterized protein [Venturia canescens]|uniref:uncharacterized protein n=1 Tax=Venturia canescens TaxID=32260 RepID=UPI001C9C798D|nr:uncharacterized protein LOC122416252 [Venturia canescens]